MLSRKQVAIGNTHSISSRGKLMRDARLDFNEKLDDYPEYGPGIVDRIRKRLLATANDFKLTRASRQKYKPDFSEPESNAVKSNYAPTSAKAAVASADSQTGIVSHVKAKFEMHHPMLNDNLSSSVHSLHQPTAPPRRKKYSPNVTSYAKGVAFQNSGARQIHRFASVDNVAKMAPCTNIAQDTFKELNANEKIASKAFPPPTRRSLPSTTTTTTSNTTIMKDTNRRQRDKSASPPPVDLPNVNALRSNFEEKSSNQKKKLSTRSVTIESPSNLEFASGRVRSMLFQFEEQAAAANANANAYPIAPSRAHRESNSSSSSGAKALVTPKLIITSSTAVAKKPPTPEAAIQTQIYSPIKCETIFDEPLQESREDNPVPSSPSFDSACTSDAESPIGYSFDINQANIQHIKQEIYNNGHMNSVNSLAEDALHNHLNNSSFKSLSSNNAVSGGAPKNTLAPAKAASKPCSIPTPPDESSSASSDNESGGGVFSRLRLKKPPQGMTTIFDSSNPNNLKKSKIRPALKIDDPSLLCTLRDLGASDSSVAIVNGQSGKQEDKKNINGIDSSGRESFIYAEGERITVIGGNCKTERSCLKQVSIISPDTSDSGSNESMPKYITKVCETKRRTLTRRSVKFCESIETFEYLSERAFHLLAEKALDAAAAAAEEPRFNRRTACASSGLSSYTPNSFTTDMSLQEMVENLQLSNAKKNSMARQSAFDEDSCDTDSCDSDASSNDRYTNSNSSHTQFQPSLNGQNFSQSSAADMLF